MTAPLTQDQVAAILCVTKRRVQQMDVDGDGPIRNADGQYVASEFGDWLKKRTEGGDIARLNKAQADIAEMKAAELAGELVRRAAVVDGWGKSIANCRARLLTIAPTLAPRVSAPGRVNEAQHEIQTAIYEALTELANG